MKHLAFFGMGNNITTAIGFATHFSSPLFFGVKYFSKYGVKLGFFRLKNYLKEGGKDEMPAVRLVKNCSAIYKVHPHLLIRSESEKSDSSSKA